MILLSFIVDIDEYNPLDEDVLQMTIYDDELIGATFTIFGILTIVSLSIGKGNYSILETLT